MHIGFEAMADHADGVANVVLRVEREFLRQHVQHLAVFRQRDAARGFDGATNVFALHVASAAAQGDAAAAVYAAHVAAGDAGDGRLHRHAHQRFRFLHRAADRADGQIEVDDLSLAPALRFGGAERGEFHAPVVIHLADQRAGLGAADIQCHYVPVFFCQCTTPYAATDSRNPCVRSIVSAGATATVPALSRMLSGAGRALHRGR
jgi:hypothetical protein